ncbi:hypothetical protein FisN_7Hh378 [Fistulifera solaris]|uniref:Protein transport protein SEC24 n=1 Tax=Fistulifera solaris TaxID=1519565 RepID=A0A1Z5KRT9_FISSO|nr:hypothetical protein FisN_7Hh378 [Fistulifera solaris]|eukprot:GAX29030.1 hypothetical protein FisN_7Hh378 [Fistulifera solaris]
MPSFPLPPPPPPGNNGHKAQQYPQSTVPSAPRFTAPPPPQPQLQQQQQPMTSQLTQPVNGVASIAQNARFLPPPPPMSGGSTGAHKIMPPPPVRPPTTFSAPPSLESTETSTRPQHAPVSFSPPSHNLPNLPPSQSQIPPVAHHSMSLSQSSPMVPSQSHVPPLSVHGPSGQPTPGPTDSLQQSYAPPPVSQPSPMPVPPPVLQPNQMQPPPSQNHLPSPSPFGAQGNPPVSQPSQMQPRPLPSHVPPPPPFNAQSNPPVSQSFHQHPPPPQSRMAPPPQGNMYPQSSHSQMPMHPPSYVPPPAPPSQMYPPSTSTPNMYPSSQSHAYPPSHARGPPPPPIPYNDSIDVSLIPRPLSTPSSSPYYPRAQMGQPPPLQLSATLMDDGNAAPHVLRSTVYQFPASRAQWHSTGDIPLALQCVPLAVPSQDFVASLPEEIEETNASVPMLPITNAPPRCTNCLAYANPFATDHKCIFCGVGQTQALVTARPEATVEWEVTGPYITRPTPVQPVQLYVLDLTSPHVEAYKSMLQQLGQDMTDHYQQQASGAAPRIGLCLVSSMGIMIPRWNASSGEISCMVVADVTEDPFTPAPLEDWTFVMNESADAWCQLLDNLNLKQWRKESFARNAYGLDGSELSCGGAALAFLSNALASSGGRGTLLTWRRPNFGVGSLAYREESQALLLGRSRAENTLTYVPVQSQKKPEGNEDETAALFYSKLAEECVTNRVTLDIVMHTGSVSVNSFLGLASMGELCRVTSGRLYWVQAMQWEESLYNDLRSNIRAFSGWDAVFKVRCSAGVQIKNFVYAPGKSREGALGDSPELELASLSPNTCISVELDHRVGGLPKSSSTVYFQTALLYTSLSGRRLVRVSTLAIPIAKSANDVFQGADFAAILPYLVRTTHAHLIKTINEQKKDDKLIPRQKARDALYATCLNMLVNYRLNTPAISSPTGQLLLPSSLQLLPLFCMCLIKLPLLAPGFPCRDPATGGTRIQPSGDERGYFNFQLLQSNPCTCMSLLYPNIYSIDLNSPDNNQDMPPLVRPTMESFQDDGIYLIDDGLRIFLYLGRLVPEDTKERCARRRHELLEHWLSHVIRKSPRSTSPAIIPVFQQPDHQGLRETGILSLLVEDANVGEKDYVAFLTNMHCDIRNRLQSKK